MVTYIDRSDLPNADEPLFEGVQLNFQPEYILHCRYSFGWSEVNGQKTITFTKKVTTYIPERLGSALSIDAFINELRAGAIKHRVIANPKQPDDVPKEPDSTPLDIGVDARCFVVVDLDPRCNWMFSQQSAAFTQKFEGHKDENGQLHHIRPSTGKAETQVITDEECTICFFQVHARSDREPRPFNCNVRLIDRAAGYALEIGIDPDIPNTGDRPTIP